MTHLKRVLARYIPADLLAELPSTSLYAVNYHSIPQTHISVFKRHLCLMRDAGFESCSPSDLEILLHAKQGDARKRLLISFDDGFADNIRAADILESFGWRGWFFVPAALATGDIGKVQEQFGAGQLMKKADIRELSQRGHIIGAHGFNHVRLGDDIERRTIEYEVVSARDALEQAIGRPVPYFCWVGGEMRSYGRLAYHFVNCAYDFAFTTFAHPIRPGQHKYFLDRTNMKSHYTDAEVRLAFSSIVRAWHHWRKMMVMRRLEQG